MTVADKILSFYSNLDLNNSALPPKVDVLNPYKNPSAATQKVINEFYRKYYDDHENRGLILGINPGRFGAGLTGIPFTDSYRLKDFCGIDFSEDTRETSSVFVYDVIEAYGGATAFYKSWFIGAASPLGFIKLNEKGNWVNYNYYDDPDLEKAVKPFIIQKLKEQKAICGNPRRCIVLGTGKNFKYLQKLNNEIGLFNELIPLEHPRYIMQYKLKSKAEYVTKYLRNLT